MALRAVTGYIARVPFSVFCLGVCLCIRDLKALDKGKKNFELNQHTGFLNRKTTTTQLSGSCFQPLLDSWIFFRALMVAEQASFSARKKKGQCCVLVSDVQCQKWL